jgi:hypothetical protein
MSTLGEWLRKQSFPDIEPIVEEIKTMPAVRKALIDGASSVTISWEDFSAYTGFKNIKRLDELLAEISRNHDVNIEHTTQELNEWSHGTHYAHYIVITW